MGSMLLGIAGSEQTYRHQEGAAAALPSTGTTQWKFHCPAARLFVLPPRFAGPRELL